ncbi:unnamed protein product [Thelazia callipaeda]|uniref:BACK domain-containing protein n=1 Tax=Thelazia callipaeda TaxID=103827 RepID=A0A0N5D9L0_THECL|nr:unnamed protein product [Thelazia callipaeda]
MSSTSAYSANIQTKLNRSKSHYLEVKYCSFSFTEQYPSSNLCLIQLQTENKVPEKLDLSDYDVAAVTTLVNYMTSGGRASARITTSILGDMTEIAQVLEMKSLLQKIEEFIMISVRQSDHFLVRTLSMISKEMMMDTPLGRKIIDIAVKHFPRICKVPAFHDIPIDVIVRIFDRCDLNVESEYDLVNVAIEWLTVNPERVYASYLILRCIRMNNLSWCERINLINRLNTLPNYARIASAFAFYTFSNTNAYRVCVLASHTMYKRCGNKSGQLKFVIDVPRRKIVHRRKVPIKSTYVTAKPTKRTQPVVDDKSESPSEGEDIERASFSVCKERRTTRAERMTRYAEKRKRAYNYFILVP